MDIIIFLAGVGLVIINIIVLISIAKISDNSDAIRRMLSEEIKRQREKDNPPDPSFQKEAGIKPALSNQAILECPQCHANEYINRSEIINVAAYKNFLMKYNKYFDTLKFKCKACGNTFVKFKNIW